MHSLPTWLIIAHTLVKTTAQEVGKFVHEAGDYRITYDVDDAQKVTFTFYVPPTPGMWSSDRSVYNLGLPSEHIRYGPYPLSWVDDFTYAIDSTEANPSFRTWYKSIERLLLRNRVIQPDHHFPAAGMQFGDLTTLTFKNGDALSTNFRGERLIFERVAQSLTPGHFVYKEVASPYLEINYMTHADETMEFWAGCGDDRTTRYTVKLSRRDNDRLYVYYAARPTQSGSLDPLFQAVGRVCPSKYFDATGPFEAVFVSEETIYASFGGSRIALTKA